MQYENELSSFPSQNITKHDFKNVDSQVADIIYRINSLQAQGKYSEAAAFFLDNREVLSQYIVDASTFRTWEEEIYNTQIYAKQVQQSVYFDQYEPDCLEGDVWIGD